MALIGKQVDEPLADKSSSTKYEYSHKIPPLSRRERVLRIFMMRSG